MAKNIRSILKKLGFVPYKDRFGIIIPGVHTLKGFHAPVALMGCEHNEIDILKSAVLQLSTDMEDSFQHAVEKDTLD